MATCRSCGTPIVWLTTFSDAAMPVEPDPDGTITVEAGRAFIWRQETPPDGRQRFTAHWARCPQAKQWRRR